MPSLRTIALACALTLFSSHPSRAIGVVDLAMLGGGFVSDIERGDQCKTVAEVTRGAGAKLGIGILGGTVGSVLGAATGGSVGSAVKGGVIGGIVGGGLGYMADRAADAASRPQGSVREYEYGLCQIIRHGQQNRVPMLERMIQDLAPRCGIAVDRFSSDPDGAMQALFQCGASQPRVKALIDAYAADIAALNYGTCRAAVRFTERADNVAARNSLQGGGSFISRIVPTCSAQSPEHVWSLYYRSR